MLVSSLQRSAGLITLHDDDKWRSDWVCWPAGQARPGWRCSRSARPVFTLLHCSTISSHGRLDAHARTLVPGHQGHHGQSRQTTFQQLRGWAVKVRGSLTLQQLLKYYILHTNIPPYLSTSLTSLPLYLVLYIEGKVYRCLAIFPLCSCTLWSMIWLPWPVGYQCFSENIEHPTADILNILNIIYY